MSCLNTNYTRLGGVSTEFDRIGGDMRVSFALVCSTSAGRRMLYDINGARLLSVQGEYLIVK